MTNLSILERNVFHAFRGVTDDVEALGEAEATYLRRTGPHCKVYAEDVALEWLWLNDRLTPMLSAAAKPFGGTVPQGLREFFRDRHHHYRFPPKPGAGHDPLALVRRHSRRTHLRPRLRLRDP